MRKLASGLGIGSVLIVVLALLLRRSPNSSGFTIGPPLPPGKVTPQLISTWDIGVLVSPDGSLWCWGGAQFQLSGLFKTRTVTQTPLRIGSDSDWRAVAASPFCVLAQKLDGSLWGFGQNQSGQLAQPKPSNQFTEPTRIGSDTNWFQFCVGMGHSLALKSDGSLWSRGQNDRGQVGDGTTSNKFTVTRIGADTDWRTIAAGAFNSFALKSNGTLWGWGLDPVTGGTNDDLSPRQIDPSTNWISISAGDFALLALKSDSTLWIGGQNVKRLFPDSVVTATGRLTQIGQDHDWLEVYTGQSFFFARKRDGSWWVCGDNAIGQLGTPSVPASSPRRLPFGFEPWAFAAGYGNASLLTRDGKLWSWGYRLGSGTNSRSFVSRVKETMDGILAIVLKRPRLLQDNGGINDSEPHLIWELPNEVRKSLGKAPPDSKATDASSSPH